MILFLFLFLLSRFVDFRFFLFESQSVSPVETLLRETNVSESELKSLRDEASRNVQEKVALEKKLVGGKTHLSENLPLL